MLREFHVEELCEKLCQEVRVTTLITVEKLSSEIQAYIYI
jgi:hypothetical protein